MLLSAMTGPVTARSPSSPTPRGRPLQGPQGLPGCVGMAMGLSSCCLVHHGLLRRTARCTGRHQLCALQGAGEGEAKVSLAQHLEVQRVPTSKPGRQVRKENQCQAEGLTQTRGGGDGDSAEGVSG